MTTWQYCTITRNGQDGQAHIFRPPPQSHASNDLEYQPDQSWGGLIQGAGQHGWELVAVVRVGDGEQWHFKRPVQG